MHEVRCLEFFCMPRAQTYFALWDQDALVQIILCWPLCLPDARGITLPWRAGEKPEELLSVRLWRRCLEKLPEIDQGLESTTPWKQKTGAAVRHLD